jgi:hypothetical protein
MEHTPQPLSEADAAHRMAIKTAEGDEIPQDWAAALDHLQHAAELGSHLAQAELAGLSGEWALANDILAGEAVPESRWSRFRSAIDLAKWLEPLGRPDLSEAPRIAIVEDIAVPEMCDWLIARARPRTGRVNVYDRKKDEYRISNLRTNHACFFRGRDRDFFFAILRARIADVTETGVDQMESPSVLHYLVGQEFQPHFDILLDPDSPDYAKKFAEGGQRALTFLLSLNDDYEGGETEFPVLGERWKGRKGSALFFWSVEPDGKLDPLTLHAGLPPTRGEKWMLSQWIRNRRRTEDSRKLGSR